MWSVLQFVTLLVVGLNFQGGNAASDCPWPAEENLLIYFDIEQISSMKLQHDFTGLFQEPLLCNKGDDNSCAGQACCEKEVGCCLADTRNHIRKCRWKEKGSSQCTYPAPLAILGKSECNSDKKMRFATCMRERRVEQVDYLLGKNFTGQPVVEGKPNQELKRTQRWANEIIDVIPGGEFIYDIKTEARLQLRLQQFSVDDLTDNLSKALIDHLIQRVAERTSKGKSYGLQE